MALQITIWILFFTFVFILADQIFISRGINYFHKYYYVAGYYLLSAGLALWFYSRLISDYLRGINIFWFALPLALFTISFLVYPYFNKNLRVPKDFSHKQSRLFFLRMDYRFVIGKFFDILFQEIMILILILLLLENNMQWMNIRWVFIIIFPTIHLLLVFTEGWYSSFYILSALLGSIFLPVFLIKTAPGIYLSWSMHWLIYLMGRIGFGIWFEKHPPKLWFFKPYWIRKKLKKTMGVQ